LFISPCLFVSLNFSWCRVSRGQHNGFPRPLISVFYTRSRYCSIQVALQLSSQGWVNPFPDALLLRKSGSTENRTRDLWICSQELWPLDHRGGSPLLNTEDNSDAYHKGTCMWSLYTSGLLGFWSSSILRYSKEQ
jgi:hypothetical protein